MGRGRHEINFTHAEPLPMADMHVLFKQGVKEIAEQHGKAVTFMARTPRPRRVIRVTSISASGGAAQCLRERAWARQGAW